MFPHSPGYTFGFCRELLGFSIDFLRKKRKRCSEKEKPQGRIANLGDPYKLIAFEDCTSGSRPYAIFEEPLFFSRMTEDRRIVSLAVRCSQDPPGDLENTNLAHFGRSVNV